MPSAVDKVAAAAAPLLDDLRRSGLTQRDLDIVPPSEHGEWVDSATAGGVVVDYGGHSFLLDASRPLAELTVEIADRIQDDVVDDLGAGWPPGDDGAGPMEAGLSPAGKAVWFDAGRETVPIGSFNPH